MAYAPKRRRFAELWQGRAERLPLPALYVLLHDGAWTRPAPNADL